MAINGFKSREWAYSYRTSSASPDGQPVNILHDFYIPVLSLSIRYDRVAGYFRSTSLAAASQGFSAFTDSGGKMRLVVGADLAEEDVSAILRGDAQRMADHLNQQLDQPEIWPEEVTRGVELLAWMIAKKYLEIRVAFRIHKKTRKPLSFSAVEDGYVHEKWAVFTDSQDNRLYIGGSLNESRTALVLNAENIDVHGDWWNDIEQQRTDKAQADFETVWNDRSPHLRVMTLPEAVRQKLIQFSQSVRVPTEIDGTTLCQTPPDPPSAMERLRFALIKDGPVLPGGRFVGMETAPVKAWPHQEIVARRLIETWPYSYLLCDEVGLGKTIEAGLAIRSLYLSGFARRVLIAAPASLTEQWHREMASKFFLPFARALSGSSVRHAYIFPRDEIISQKKLLKPSLCIVSTGLISRKERRKELQTAENFDIALIDEAHYARRKNPKNGARSYPKFGNLYKTIQNDLRKRSASLWLATATPMQIDWIEVFDLLSLTNRVGQFQFDPSLTRAYYDVLGAMVQEQVINESQWEFLRRAIASLNHHDPFLWKYLHESVIDGRIRTAARHWLERGRIPKGADRKNIQRLIFSAAPLSRVMLRHTRALLEIYREKGELEANLAKREILPVPRIVFTALEKKAYNELETYCKDLAAQITHKLSASLGLLLSFLRLRFASSLFAIRETLRRRKERVTATLFHLSETDETEDIEGLEAVVTGDEDQNDDIIKSLLKHRTPQDLEWERDRLTEMLMTLEDISDTPSKMKELLSVLYERRISDGRIRQTVVFTRFCDTLQDIVNRLRETDSSMRIGTYSGKGGEYVDPHTKDIFRVQREEIKHRFMRGEIDVLICTDAAAEGLNLQTADLLINYDLPWNPMKVEQRIGRIDRIGQKHDRICVLNLCYADSAEQIVYDRLLRRLAQAGNVVGSQQISMLPVSIDEFNDLAAGTLSPEELETRAKERIALQGHQTARMEIPARDIYDIYMRLSEKHSRNPPPVTLKALWQTISESKYLRDLGCALPIDNEMDVILLKGLSPVPDHTALTASRSLYEQGLENMEGRLHFASYGDPVFETVLDEINRFDLPECILRITEQVPDTSAEVAAYAAACLDEKDLPQIRLITSLDNLDGLRLNESARITESDLTDLKQSLHSMIRREFDTVRTVKRLEKDNQRAAVAHIIMDLMSAKSLLRPIGSTADDNFRTIVKDLDALISEREQLIITELPTEPLKMIANELLFDIQMPKAGQRINITAPILIVAASADAGCRIADAIKVKKGALTVNMVLSRIGREIERQFKSFKSFGT